MWVPFVLGGQLVEVPIAFGGDLWALRSRLEDKCGCSDRTWAEISECCDRVRRIREGVPTAFGEQFAGPPVALWG